MTTRSASQVWADAIADYARFLAAAGRRRETIRLRTYWVRRFSAESCADPFMPEPTAVLEWSAAYEWSRETRKSAHCSLSSFYAWAVETKRTADPPVIPSIRGSDPCPHPARLASIVRALRSTDPRVHLMVRLAAEAGLRRGEVSRIHVGRDLIADLCGRSLIVHGKGGKRRIVPLTDSLADELEAAGLGYAFPGNDHGHLSAQRVGDLVADALPPGETMHSLRHAFATRGYAATRDLVAVQRALGHASTETTLRYVQVPDAAVRKVVESVADPVSTSRVPLSA